MIEEIRRQFREIPGLMEGTTKPNYAACVNIATRGALRELLPLIVFTICTTLVVGFVTGIRALAGYLSGAIFSGFFLAILMANAGLPRREGLGHPQGRGDRGHGRRPI